MSDRINIFADYQEGKAKVRRVAEAAYSSGWIDRKTLTEIVEKVESDVLTIGIIGQTNSGKSTFLNALLFGRPVLPISSTPMTAGLSIIAYGEEAGLSVEFYSLEEWQEIVALSTRAVGDGDDPQLLSAVQAAKEMVKDSEPIADELPSLLGTDKADEFGQLAQYVGVGGRYVPIVKYAKIFLPYDWLKGVEIVDTPGFNDPVASREARTADFLKRSDVAIVMLYAGRAFDSTDTEIIFDKASKVGVGRIVLAVNKYDVQLLAIKPETPEQLKIRVKNAVDAYVSASGNPALAEALGDVDPMPLSALMAMIAKMPIVEINADEALRAFYDKMADEFSLKSPAELGPLSLIAPVEEKVRDIIASQKEELLLRQPVARIRQIAKDALGSLRERIATLERKKETLSIPDGELEDKIASLEKAQRAIYSVIEQAKEDFSVAYAKVSREFIQHLENLSDDAKRECLRYTNSDQWGKLNRAINQKLDDFKRRVWPRAIQEFPEKLEGELRRYINDLSKRIGDILRNCIADFYYVDEIVAQFERTLKKSVGVELQDPMFFMEELGFKARDKVEVAFKTLAPFVNIWGIPVTLIDGGRDKARAYVVDAFGKVDQTIEGIQRDIYAHQSSFVGQLSGEGAYALTARLREQTEAACVAKHERVLQLAGVVSELQNAKQQLAEMEASYASLKEIIA